MSAQANGDLYGRLFHDVMFPLWESTLRGRTTLSIRRQLEETQWYSPAELEGLQLRSLRRLLTHAVANVPYYRGLAQSTGFDPTHLQSLSDYPRFPLLTREMAFDSYKERRSLAPPFPTINKATGGSTASPLRFAYDAGSEEWRQAIKLRGWGWAGYRPGRRVLYYWIPPTRPETLAGRIKLALDQRLRREHYVDCARRGEADFAKVIADIRRTRPEILICYAQAGAELARHVVERGARDWDDIPVLCCAEPLFAGDREMLRKAFGPSIYQTYGCREIMLLGCECQHHAGLHVSAENVLVEIIVRKDGQERPAGPGETGEVVLTDLHNYGMPFIRYLNGDLATFAGSERCACGRWLPRIASVDGRVAGSFADAAGAPISGLLFQVALTPYAEHVRQFQAVQHVDHAITLKYVPSRSFDGRVQRALEQHLLQMIPGIPVTLQSVNEIPLGKNGKRQPVIVEREKTIP